MSAPPRIAGVGLVLIERGRVLLVRRRNPPRAGEWSLPGGKQMAGETARQAALRELAEETGLKAVILGLVDVVDATFPDAPGGARYTLIEFAARPAGGALRAGSDASEAAWHDLAGLPGLGLWSETERVIDDARQRFFAPS